MRKPDWELIQGDCIDVLKYLEVDSVDAIVTDPPYLLEFMGKNWDRAEEGREWHHRWAEEALRVLKPGGHVLAFGHSRTSHHLVSGIEEAGFEIRDSLMWIYSQGFPKGKNLKPAHEPIAVGRKPFKGTEKANYEEYEVGPLNIDACRVGDVGPPSNRFKNGAKPWGNAVGEEYETTGPTEGRWPANVVLSIDDPLLERYFYCAKPTKKEKDAGLEEDVPNDRFRTRICVECGKNVPSGGACGCPRGKVRWEAAKPSKNFHSTVKPIRLMQWLCRLVAPSGGLVVDPFVGSGTTGIAATLEGLDFLGIDKDEENEGYIDLARKRIEHWNEDPIGNRKILAG